MNEFTLTQYEHRSHYNKCVSLDNWQWQNFFPRSIRRQRSWIRSLRPEGHRTL